jgi:hypothetical protein
LASRLAAQDLQVSWGFFGKGRVYAYQAWEYGARPPDHTSRTLLGCLPRCPGSLARRPALPRSPCYCNSGDSNQFDRHDTIPGVSSKRRTARASRAKWAQTACQRCSKCWELRQRDRDQRMTRYRIYIRTHQDFVNWVHRWDQSWRLCQSLTADLVP